MDYSTYSDGDLQKLLYTEEDRLERAAADELIRRGERLVPYLSEIVSSQFRWTADAPDWWAVVHATFILGAIGTEPTVLPLLRALRWADAFDCDWVTEAIPSIFCRIGPAAVDPLKMMARDQTSGCFTRGIAMESLGMIACRHPAVQKEIGAFMYSVFMNEMEDLEIRQSAGNVLLNMRCAQYKDDLLAFARQERGRKNADRFYLAHFFEEDVERTFKGEGLEAGWYDRDWMSFYDEKEIAKRQERWRKEAAEDLAEERESFPVLPRTLTGPFLSVDSSNSKVINRQKQNCQGTRAKVGRNEPCPCGSGRKYKRCCGAIV